MKTWGRFGLVAALLIALAAVHQLKTVKAGGGPLQGEGGNYRALAPIESGNLLLFPVVRADDRAEKEFAGEIPFITLDEGLKSGEVEVTEAGRARGLVRPRGPASQPAQDNNDRGDEVNTLVLVNNSKRPLLLLAGEIVTGGKQDRIVAKDRIVPANADPIDLGVFCIEPGRWTESSANFGVAGKSAAKSFMVQPEVRERAMVDQDQQQVWDSVHGTISQMEVAATPPASGGSAPEGSFHRTLGTSSYAKAMQDSDVSKKVDEAAAPLMGAREQVLAQLRDEHAVGVVVAVRGEIIWADLFANTDLLSRYWTKLVRSYAAESLTEGEDHPAATLADAQRFLDAPSGGKENSEGEVGIYRYRELKSSGTETFVLESLLPGTGYDVHLSKMKLRGEESRNVKPHSTNQPIFRPDFYRPGTIQ
jgi:ARG/rhodanese/phosphatase superfamily protein